MRVKVIPAQRQKAFRAALSDRWRRVYDLGICTGLRISDLLGARVDDLNGRVLSIRAKKTGKESKHSLPEAIACDLRRFAGQFWLFPSPVNPVFPVTRQAAYKAFRKAARKLKLENCAPHSLRKSFAQAMLHEGASVQSIQAALQHDKIETTLLYLVNL